MLPGPRKLLRKCCKYITTVVEKASRYAVHLMANEDTVQVNSKPRIYWYSEYKIRHSSSGIFASILEHARNFWEIFRDIVLQTTL